MRRVIPFMLGLAGVGVSTIGFVELQVPAAAAFQVLGVVRDIEASVKAYEQELAPHFRYLHRSELHFMRLVCQPTRGQFEKISVVSEIAMKEALNKHVLQILAQQNGATVQADEFVNPQAKIDDAIAKGLATTMSPDKSMRFQKEVRQRAEAINRTATLSLVVKADGLLMLSAEQRAKFETILGNHWHGSLNQLRHLASNVRVFPLVAEQEINSILTEAQRVVWRGVPKAKFSIGFDLEFVEEFELDDECWPEDSRPQKPPESTVNKPVMDKGYNAAGAKK